ncbi:hypothetical protein AB0M79_15055 [Polymorphospora sp. NPDC051019]|uniref:hypothetical protein n=1 Tax=Polymorphospora sp. NPDC051019 TaxID=3155725 RepID=UPI0034225E7E
MLSPAGKHLTRNAVLAAIVAGDRTERHLADRFGIVLHPVWKSPALSGLLRDLVCDGLLYQEVAGRSWQYKPTRAGRTAVKAQ